MVLESAAGTCEGDSLDGALLVVTQDLKNGANMLFVEGGVFREDDDVV